MLLTKPHEFNKCVLGIAASEGVMRVAEKNTGDVFSTGFDFL
jgi:hypothetical protein